MVRTCLICNPTAGRGAAGKKLARIIDCFAAVGVTDILYTRAPRDEERVTRAALDLQCRTIVVVGGDGTCSGVANALVASGAECALAVVPAGTGNDFAKSLGVRNMPVAQIAQLVVVGSRTPIDVGRVDGRYFINSCGFGFDASVLEATQRVSFLKGDALYIYAALKQLLSYRGFPVTVNGTADDTTNELLMVTVSNGQFLGGAFHIAPEASVLDGALDICLVRDANVLQRVRLFASAFRGTHGRLPSVRAFQTPRISLVFASPPAIELDGELRQAKSREVTIECVSRRLNVIAAHGARL